MILRTAHLLKPLKTVTNVTMELNGRNTIVYTCIKVQFTDNCFNYAIFVQALSWLLNGLVYFLEYSVQSVTKKITIIDK